jgi:hypothetical protein
MEVSVVEPTKHPLLQFAGFARFGPQNPVVRFRRESRTSCGIITKGMSRRSNFMMSV